ncbi:MAG: TIGR00645 family protein [Bdellovibrionaceae bacterium]|nr:TIGR00645 family protein [Pseudobdellovibrionaceae bacterium]
MSDKSNLLEKWIEVFIFNSRWFQAPLYIGLVFAGVLYSYKFVIELVHLAESISTISEEFLMLGVLTLVDITMVANLLIMVIVGGYATFVSKLDLNHHRDRPDWLEKIDAGVLKVKLATALVGISGIHLLKSFINIQNKSIESVQWQVVIHVVFLFSAVMLAWTEKIIHDKHH